MLPILNKAHVLQHPELGVSESYFNYPERILQFGTGVLLRGLVDYLVDKANKQGIYQGRIVVVKSTGGDTTEFGSQDNLFTTNIKGIAQGELVNQVLVNAAISRVLQSNAEWDNILKAVRQPTLQTIVSNTTEVGIQYVEEGIDGVPVSFPGKLLAILWERFQYFKGASHTGFVIVPTELVVNNGQLLKEIVLKLAAYNKLPANFVQWLENDNHFCSSLVDRIVPGKPKDLSTLQEKAGYTDGLWIDTEPYLLWAIEGDERVKDKLGFHQADNRMLIAPDITPFREQKLRILNGSHTISVPLGYLSGMNTVVECMEDSYMRSFFRTVIIEEILPTIKDICPHAPAFAEDVLDRFSNPNIAHKLLSITFQESMKMNARNVRTIVRYYEQFEALPASMCLGFAAMLLFLRPQKVENGQYAGQREQESYTITDDNIGIFATYWTEVTGRGGAAVADMVQAVCADRRLWEADLSQIPGFAEAVAAHLQGMLQEGVKAYADSYSKVL
ncbi:tagaturonate reductase [Chitinophaga rhizophila]|uniref:Tagaturonate reductase n=1 Tax=Chitinophaga rhizophila TaxID=2866212 RepID=A0ABS7GCF1_9BACT|nr:tagaturonate reductase [Chitinophaga rhizophila]MBW8685344.1 tagaturonate reductase [Chitinophaga rhizophila]